MVQLPFKAALAEQAESEKEKEKTDDKKEDKDKDKDKENDKEKEKKSGGEDEPPSWFTYEGPKISLAFTAGAAHEMTLVGFQASTSISHKQSINVFGASMTVNGPLLTEIEIKGAKDSIKMDLGASLEIAPGAYYHRAKARAEARAIEAQANAVDKDDAGADVSAQAGEIENTGAKSDIGVNTNANVTHVQS